MPEGEAVDYRVECYNRKLEDGVTFGTILSEPFRVTIGCKPFTPKTSLPNYHYASSTSSLITPYADIFEGTSGCQYLSGCSLWIKTDSTSAAVAYSDTDATYHTQIGGTVTQQGDLTLAPTSTDLRIPSRYVQVKCNVRYYMIYENKKCIF